MARVNWGRVLLGGLAAGVVINIFEFMLNGWILADDWAQAMQALGKSGATSAGQMVTYILWAFAAGLAAVWLYAAIRPRYGAGPKTALCAGATVWFLAYLMAMVPPLIMEMMPARLIVISLAVGLVESLLGTLAGAWLYREASQPA